MIIYHAAWFSDDARLLSLEMTALHWRAFQKSIAGTFFFLVGLSLQLATTSGLNTRRYLMRLGKLLLCAAVVTITSVILNPDRLITFGILHSIAACSVLAMPLTRTPMALNLLFSIGMILAGTSIQLPMFNHPALNWIGLFERGPHTFDHQPLLPWLGVVLLGGVVGRSIPEAVRSWQRTDRATQGLAVLGRWSLWIYMAHVPILMIGVMVLQQLLM